MSKIGLNPVEPGSEVCNIGHRPQERVKLNTIQSNSRYNIGGKWKLDQLLANDNW